MVVTDTFFPASPVREIIAVEEVAHFHDWVGGHQPGPSEGPFCSDIPQLANPSS